LSVRDSRKTFSNTVVGCLALAQTVNRGTGTQVIVGAGFNPVTQAMAYVFSDPQNDLAQIAYASNISSLSHNDVFPDFLRTYPSSSFEAYALAHTIKKHFRYTRVTLIRTSGLYGIDSADEFIITAAALGIDIVSEYTFDRTETDFSTIQNSAKFDIRVYVLFMGSLKAAGNLMLYMTQTGLINDKTVTFGTSSMANSELWTSVTNDPVMINKMVCLRKYVKRYMYICIYIYK
jgi:ABC-type branched-subunit amino acid transport system substrate-binding protein